MTDEKRKPEEDEVGDEQLEDVSGGAAIITGAAKGSGEAGAIPDVMQTPDPGGSGIPIPFPNVGGEGVPPGDAIKKAAEAGGVPDISKPDGM